MISKSYPQTGRKEHPVDAAFWESCYAKGDTFWDHGKPSPGLVDFLAKEKYEPGKVLVPGCGRGHDCVALAQAGFVVTGLDISRRAIEEAGVVAKAANVKVTYRRGDFLKLPASFHGRFDWIFEHTCFCAIDPELRGAYVRAVGATLKPRGHFLGVFYNIQPDAGPPFGTTREELIERFHAEYRLLVQKIPRSFANREGKELLMHWRKKT